MLAPSAAQYELQFKKWGFAKNLKSGEWAALISQHDLLRQTKRDSDVRITVSGSVVGKKTIDRNRRRYRPRHNRLQDVGGKGKKSAFICCTRSITSRTAIGLTLT